MEPQLYRVCDSLGLREVEVSGGVLSIRMSEWGRIGTGTIITEGLFNCIGVATVNERLSRIDLGHFPIAHSCGAFGALVRATAEMDPDDLAIWIAGGKLMGDDYIDDNTRRSRGHVMDFANNVGPRELNVVWNEGQCHVMDMAFNIDTRSYEVVSLPYL